MAGIRRLCRHCGTTRPEARIARGVAVLAFIGEEEPLARRGVVLRLRKFKDIEIVGQCGDGVAAVEKILELSPDLVFLDVQMPGMDGFEVLRTGAETRHRNRGSAGDGRRWR